MAFIWDRHTIEMAVVLAKAGYSSSETAEVMGISRSAVLGRSNRKREFQFKTPCRGTAFDEKARAIRLASARELIKDIIPPAEPHKPVEFISKKSRERLAAAKQKANSKKVNPVLWRTYEVVEKPLTEDERRMILEVDGLNPESVSFIDLKEKHCKWIVSEVDGLNTMFCGKQRLEESSYCQHHRTRSVTKHQPKRLSYKAALKLDRNIVHAAPTMEKTTSLLKKS